jgi:Predicted membrane protein (DUF2142)
MSQLEQAAPLVGASARTAARPPALAALRSSPVAVFLLLSALFGPLVLAITPPLRGPDEPAHFLRAYGILSGEIIPATADDRGRKGVFLPAELHRQMDSYERALGGIYRSGAEQWTFGEVLAEYARLRDGAMGHSDAPVFVNYGGSEGYSPAPYLPYLPGLALARLLDLDVVPTVYVMRATAFLILTAIMAAAIAIVPALPWAFLLIALLPSALFSRAMLSADGSSLAYTMMAAALCLRAAYGLRSEAPWLRSLWMTLCVLGKPPQIVFVLGEAMRAPLTALARHWRRSAVVVVPAVAVTLLWAAVSSGDVAAWRIVDGTTNATEHFQPLWKLRFLLEHPLHFPALLVGTTHHLGAYALQLIGILGWLDIRLQEWVYPILGLTMLFGLWAPLQVDAPTRRRLAAVSALTVLGYCLAVFLVFYLVWTPINGVRVEGVQGRYFVVALPFVAIMLSALIRRGPSPAMIPSTAIFGSVVSGLAAVEAILRSDWRLSLLPL